MKNPALLSCTTLLLWSLCAAAQPAAASASTAAPASTLQARISRVEQGLSTRIVVKGSPERRMALEQRMAFHRVPAVSIALIDQGRIAWARAYGVADAASQQPATTTTRFQAGSISKPLSALGALRLVEQGRLSLDADANGQLASWKIPQNAFTRAGTINLRRLLNHSAGVTVHGYDGYAPGQPLPTLLQVLDGIAPANSEPVRVDIAPGSAWRYSGGGYSIVQLMMTEASGQPFDRYLETAVLQPLGMAHSTYAVPPPESVASQAGAAHDGNGQVLAGRWRLYPESAAAGLWSTPSDLAQVILEVQRAEAGGPGSILSRDMVSTMLTRGLGEYGLGFFVEDLGDRTSFSHSGGTEGFRSQLYGYTRSGQGAVIMTNSINGAALIDEILCSIAAEYGWPEFQVVEKTAIPTDVATNRLLAGDYRLLDQPAHVVAEGERLYFQSDLFGAGRMELFRESEDSFFMTAQDMRIRFRQDGAGTIAGFDLVRGAGTYAAHRTR
ncbi:class A beta-lactamase-related serine hydrolase [Stenotrophomonas acidaminiphila]|uniref:serine hydrolase domain-containing protein n=1 Tax=Stenotrophomonas acidaminiphila TaxID=128780 RepID=UPI000A468270|nr:serine hydrolase domain-containing protein [Stenotrophomonas acidaminiphila]MDF9440413.1 class A beta-lactamase-related serine hydrolase [Stenotrophomonas acidaminiphila]